MAQPSKRENKHVAFTNNGPLFLLHPRFHHGGKASDTITKKAEPWAWTSMEQSSFNIIPIPSQTAPVIQVPDPAEEYFLNTHAFEPFLAQTTYLCYTYSCK